MGKRIQFEDAARRALWRGMDQAVSAVRVTLGPRARNVVMDRGTGVPAISNDGLTILREIELKDPFENMGVQLIKEVATRTGEVAGDGTTTATVITHRLVGEGLEAIAAGCNPMALKRGIDRSLARVTEELRRQSSRMGDSEQLMQVATVSAGNDRILASLIVEAIDRVGTDGLITVEEGHGTETTLEVVEGCPLPYGYLSPYFVTHPEAMEVVLENALVLLVDGRVSDLAQVVPALEQAARLSRPLVVVAEDVEGEALATLVVNRLRGTVGSVALRLSGTAEERRTQLEDLAILTGGRVWSSEAGMRPDSFEASVFGRAQRVTVRSERALFARGGGRPAEIRERIAQVRRERERARTDYERDRVRMRLGRLEGAIAVIRVGGSTEVEIREKRSRIEDALGSAQAAAEEGIVVGGGVALLRAKKALDDLALRGDERLGGRILARALEEPARQISANAGENPQLALQRIQAGSGSFGYDAVAGIYADLAPRGIVDATKVVRCALQHAASIGTLLLTTDAVVVDSDESPPSPSEPTD